MQNREAISNWGKIYYKLGHVLQIRAIITNWAIAPLVDVLEIVQEIHRKTSVYQCLLFTKFTGYIITLLKKRLQHKCVSCEIYKTFKEIYFIEHFRPNAAELLYALEESGPINLLTTKNCNRFFMVVNSFNNSISFEHCECLYLTEAVVRNVLQNKCSQNFTNFTEKQLCWSLFLMKLQA